LTQKPNSVWPDGTVGQKNMRKHSRRLRFFIWLIVVIAMASTAWEVFIPGGWIGGMRSSYNAKDYDRRLTKRAKSALSVIQEVELYHKEHGRFPSEAKDYETSNSDYTPDADYQGYRLYIKFGWDPSLRYVHNGKVGIWIFDPGDGSPEREIKLDLVN
jgi:hypothetical protein